MSDRARHQNTIAGAWQLYDAERMARERVEHNRNNLLNQNRMLRETLKSAIVSNEKDYFVAIAAWRIKEALAATACLDGFVLCENEPVAWCDKHGMVAHDPFEGAVPLYRAKEQEK